MSTFLNDNMVYRVNSRVVWNLRQKGLSQINNKREKKKTIKKLHWFFLQILFFI